MRFIREVSPCDYIGERGELGSGGKLLFSRWGHVHAIHIGMEFYQNVAGGTVDDTSIARAVG